MTTRTLDSFDFPKIGVSTFSKIWALGLVSSRSGAAKREDRDGIGWGLDLGFGLIFYCFSTLLAPMGLRAHRS